MSPNDHLKKYPVYLEAYSSGLLKGNIQQAIQQLSKCDLCPRKCLINRVEGELGFCKTGYHAMVASYSPHFGEEAPLVGTHGSGTIFFSHCNLKCNFCQNFDISYEGYGVEVTESQLARIMLELQQRGCHNINFVTPSHVIPQILSALAIAIEHGLNIPLIYNTGGYDSVDSLKLLDGIVDIYMPDFKFWDPKVAEQTCNANDYPDVVRKAVKEMHNQVGDLIIDNRIAKRGLLIRHLVMPSEMSGTVSVIKFIRSEISKNTYLNIMDQYRPCGLAHTINEISRGITQQEYKSAVEAALSEGLTRLD